MAETTENRQTRIARGGVRQRVKKTGSPGTAPRPARRVLLAMDYYLHQVHEGVVAHARRAGWILDARSHHLRQLPTDWQADGVLTFVGSSDDFGPAIRASGVPVVNMSPWGAVHRMPSVQIDNHKVGQLAAEHLLGRGIRNLTMVQFDSASLTSQARHLGFSTAASKAKAKFHPLVYPHPESGNDSRTRMMDWLKESLPTLPRPLGVLTEGDLWAVEVILLCQQLGLRVPDDVAVVGVDNDPLVVEVAPVAVSSVDSNLHGLGIAAAELLDQILDGTAPPPGPIFISPRAVVQRQSTNVVAVANEEAAAAITFIHTHFRDPITVADVARESHVSRRRLQDLFLEHVGRTISQEITACRLELAKRLLFESQQKIGQIAEQCGLGSGVQMSKVFMRELQITPKEYRQRNAW